jgi:hypothetical protein
VVGDVTRGGGRSDPAQVIRGLIHDHLPLRSLQLIDEFSDAIPDIRRSRRDLQGTKQETILVYRKTTAHV